MHRCTQSKYNGKPLEHTRTDARKVNTMGNHWNTHTHANIHAQKVNTMGNHWNTHARHTHLHTHLHTHTHLQTHKQKHQNIIITHSNNKYNNNLRRTKSEKQIW